MTARTLAEVVKIVAAISGRDVAVLGPHTKLYRDLGFDSAATLELVFRLEEAFDVEIRNEYVTQLVTLDDVAAIVQHLSGQRRQSTKPPRSSARG